MRRTITLTLIALMAGGYFITKHGEEMMESFFPRQRIVTVLFDTSGSTDPMKKSYLSSFDKILKGLKAGDRIVVDKISGNSLAEATYPVNEELPEYRFWDKRSSPNFKKKNEQELEKTREDIRNRVHSFVNESEKSQTTAIMDSILLAEKVFTTYSDKKPTLVIFSDMMEVSGRANFLKEIPSTSNINQYIQNKSNGERIDLRKATIYAIGASAGGGYVSGDAYQRLQNFWIQYFDKANASLSEKDFGAALLTF